ncbi:MAG: 6-bladed beta-propeller [Dysgonamonadaceae bacterium]|jgi:hypothetical protein|nr:6-bladed beta-propeller [Dysgonamonadaceae bacterium]
MKKAVLSLVVISFIFGCNNRNGNNTALEVINVNPTTAEEYINLSEIVDSVHCIRLWVDSGDVMGRVNEILIKQKYIYAKDATQQQIFVFDKEGKFVAKLAKNGDGPDEYNGFKAFFVDDEEKYVEIITGKNILKYTNISFELAEKSPFPRFSCISSRKKDGIYYLAPQQMDNTVNGERTNAELLIVKGKNDVKILFDKHIKTNNSYFTGNEECFATNNRGELFFSTMYDNTFYKLDADTVYPILSVDFGKYGMNNSFIRDKSTDEQMKYIENMKDLASFPVLNMNDDRIMAFSYFFKEKDNQVLFRENDFRQYIKIKKNNKIYHTKTFRNDLTEFPDRICISSYFWWCNHEVWYEDYLVSVVMPEHYFKNSETKEVEIEGLGKITETDDPIVVLMKLKKDL